METTSGLLLHASKTYSAQDTTSIGLTAWYATIESTSFSALHFRQRHTGKPCRNIWQFLFSSRRKGHWNSIGTQFAQC